MNKQKSNIESSWARMKHLCIICLTKFSCPTHKDTHRYLTMCDQCLISIPLRHFKDLPIIPNYRKKR